MKHKNRFELLHSENVGNNYQIVSIAIELLFSRTAASNEAVVIVEIGRILVENVQFIVAMQLL